MCFQIEFASHCLNIELNASLALYPLIEVFCILEDYYVVQGFEISKIAKQ